MYGDRGLHETIRSALASSSSLVLRNVVVNGCRTSMRLEPAMWSALAEIARREKLTQHQICNLVHLHKSEGTTLTSAMRVFIMDYFRISSMWKGDRSGKCKKEEDIGSDGPDPKP